MAIRCVVYDHLPPQAAAIRRRVFVEEQGFVNEFDSVDSSACHALLYDDGQAVATGRLFDKEGKAVIGRVAVLPEYRGRHLGAAVMQALEKEAAARGYACVTLSAQCRARSFYEKQGYHAVGEIYKDEYCDHIRMEKNIAK